jgi:hypothetical protein
MIFPNLFIAEIQVFNIQPVAVNECIQYSTAVQLVARRAEQADGVAMHRARWGRPACCWPTTPRCTNATSSASSALTPEWLDVRRGLQPGTHRRERFHHRRSHR